jgi:hypothetical protein
MPTSCRAYKNLLMGDWPILCSCKQALKGPPRTRQHIAARQSSMAKNSFRGPWSATCHGVGLVTLKTPRASPWCEHASAKLRWGAQSGCRQRPHQLDNVELDSSNKAEAAHQVKASSKPTSIPMLDISLPRLPFLVGTVVPQRRIKIIHWEQKMGLRETTCKNEILFYRTSAYVVENIPSTDVLRNKSKRIILLIVWNVIGQEILSNFVVK